MQRTFLALVALAAPLLAAARAAVPSAQGSARRLQQYPFPYDAYDRRLQTGWAKGQKAGGHPDPLPGLKNPDVPALGYPNQISASMEDLVLPWGYPLESYPVETADGAVLRIYRIPYGVRNASRPGPRPAVLLHHGITLASSCFVVLDPESSMAFYLADAGFDVWMANTRGNTYSRGNRHYTQLEHGFWEFSMDELALLDLPSQIDFVLKTSGQKSLGFVGHSQGCTLSVMLLAAKPEYNKKIWLLMMLGAVTHVQYIAAPFLRQQVKTRSTQLFADMGVGEFAMNRVSNQVANGCKYEGVRSAFCSALINFAFYGSSTAVSPDDLVRVSVTWASGVATRNLLHWSQQYYANVSGLRMWDYGTECAKSPGFERKAFQESCNQAKYGTTTPPEYDLKQITAPAAIFQGDNDVMATVPDVDRLVREWRSKVVYREMWNDTAHMDFVWARIPKFRAAIPRVLWDNAPQMKP